MFLEINFDSDIAIYLQVRNEIIKLIAEGSLKNGDSLPSVRQMAASLEINLHTINKAYNLLKNEGYVNVDKRSGVTVNVITRDEDFEILESKICDIVYEAKAKGIELTFLNKILSKTYEKFD